MAHQHQHVWDRDHIRLVPDGHRRLKVVPSVFPVGHCVVLVKCDVVLLDAFSEFKKEKSFRRNIVAPYKSEKNYAVTYFN